MQSKLGILYVVATPIGNLQDITFRALEVLKGVDRILAEDTRHSGLLLKHFSISKPLLSLHDFNESQQLKNVIQSLQSGESLALVSDAGTPLISDPGYLLIKEAKACGIQVIPIPGPCAAITALSAAGLPTDKFVFEGFLSSKSVARSQQLKTLLTETRTMIFYEAPHRLIQLLQALNEELGGNRMACIARELTKIHESITTDSLSSLLTHFKTHPSEERGEFVIIVAGAEESGTSAIYSAKQVLHILLAELPLKQAVKLAHEITGERKNILYKMGLEFK